MATTQNISKKRKFVADGVFYAELNEFMRRELGEAGYAGVEVRAAPMRTEIIIRATRPLDVLGEKGRRLRELTTLVQQRFRFAEGAVELFAERVANRGLSAQAQVESLKFKLLGGLPVRRAAYGVVKFAMESGAKGCEVIVTGKLRAQRSKAMKFKEGYMIKTGQSAVDYIDEAVRHCWMRQGMIGCKVRIMLPHDPTGKEGVAAPLSDAVTILEPKSHDTPGQPAKVPAVPGRPAAQAAAPAAAPQQ
jgi:small subunit ribosomal protein S3e